MRHSLFLNFTHDIVENRRQSVQHCHFLKSTCDIGDPPSGPPHYPVTPGAPKKCVLLPNTTQKAPCSHGYQGLPGVTRVSPHTTDLSDKHRAGVGVVMAGEERDTTNVWLEFIPAFQELWHFFPLFLYISFFVGACISAYT